MYSPKFYREVVNPDSKKFLKLFLAVTEQPSGIRNKRSEFEVYCPENSLSAAKKVMKSWAEDLTRGGTYVRIVSVVEIKEKNGNL
jgi:hypothetical protein